MVGWCWRRTRLVTSRFCTAAAPTILIPSVSMPLAIQGGIPECPAGPPTWPRPSAAVLAALEEAYADGSWGRYHGGRVERLGAALADLSGCRHVWTCSSGTVAVELALRGLKVSAGDEVILAAYDFPGNFRAIEAIGARPVLVDLKPGSWSIDAEQVALAVTADTRAVIASHLHGSLADMPRLRAICDATGMAIVEDACQTPGASIARRPAGNWGDCGVYSFGGSKLLTAGRGGAVVTSREDVLQRIRVFCERGNDAFPLSELQAAVLLPQLCELAEANAIRRTNVERLLAGCIGIDGLVPLRLPANADDCPAFYKLAWLLEPSAFGAADFESLRQRFIAAVQAEGVALDAGFRGFALRSGQRCRTVGDLAHARRAAAATVILHHPVLLEPVEAIEGVARALQKVAAHFAAISPGGEPTR